MTAISFGLDSVASTTTASLRASWVRAQPYQRFLYRAAAVLLLWGVVHLGVFLLDGGAWSGPVSWRKPVTFGFSLGIMLATFAWVLRAFPLRPATGWVVAATLGLGSVVETFLISLQTWRGVASHFNEATVFDGMVFAGMGAMVGLIVVASAALLVRGLGRLDAPPSRAWAIRLGLLLLVIGQAVGGVMLAAGSDGAGEFKTLHAAALHGFQVMVVLGWLLGRTRMAEGKRTAAVLAAAAAYHGLLGAMLLGVVA